MNLAGKDIRRAVKGLPDTSIMILFLKNCNFVVVVVDHLKKLQGKSQGAA